MNSISIIVPCYNQGEFLEDCLESCLDQTREAHEIIVVNDGSGDNTQEIAERFMFKDFPQIQSRVRVINQTNKGLASARNTGIMNATGDYCLFLDADDMLEENAIEVISKEILISQGCDVIAPSFREFGKSNREIVLEVFSIEQLKVANRLGYFCAIKRSALLEMGGYNPKMKWGWEDYDLWFEMFKRGKKIYVLRDILVKYRVRERSMIHTANEHADELWSQIKKNHPTIFS